MRTSGVLSPRFRRRGGRDAPCSPEWVLVATIATSMTKSPKYGEEHSQARDRSLFRTTLSDELPDRDSTLAQDRGFMRGSFASSPWEIAVEGLSEDRRARPHGFRVAGEALQLNRLRIPETYDEAEPLLRMAAAEHARASQDIEP